MLKIGHVVVLFLRMLKVGHVVGVKKCCMVVVVLLLRNVEGWSCSTFVVKKY